MKVSNCVLYTFLKLCNDFFTPNEEIYFKSRLSMEKYSTDVWEWKTGAVNQQELEGSKEMRLKKEATFTDIPTLSTLFFFSWVGFLPCRLLQNVGVHLPASHCHMMIIVIVTTMQPSNIANEFLYLVIVQCSFEVQAVRRTNNTISDDCYFIHAEAIISVMTVHLFHSEIILFFK